MSGRATTPERTPVISARRRSAPVMRAAADTTVVVVADGVAEGGDGSTDHAIEMVALTAAVQEEPPVLAVTGEEQTGGDRGAVGTAEVVQAELVRAHSIGPVLLARTVSVQRIGPGRGIPVPTFNCTDVLSCCPDADTCAKICAAPAYLVVGLFIIGAAFTAAKIVAELGDFREAAVGWLGAVVMLGICVAGACLVAGVGKLLQAEECLMVSLGLGLVGLATMWLALIITSNLHVVWLMDDALPAITDIDPELIVPTQLALSDPTAAQQLAETFVQARVQGAYSEIEFARTSFVNPSLGFPVRSQECISEAQDDDDRCQPVLCAAPVLRTCGLRAGGLPEDTGATQWPDGRNFQYCQHRRRSGNRPCNFFVSGIGCAAGASQPVNLTTNFFLYWPIHADNGRRRLAAHSSSSSSATQGRRQLPEKGYYIPGAYSADLCATQWQWAFDDNDEYPQPQSFGHAGNPRPLSGHLDIEFEANKADVLAALAAHRVANISFDFGSSSAPPVFLKWQPKLSAEKDHNTFVITIWSLVFGLCWLPFMAILAFGGDG